MFKLSAVLWLMGVGVVATAQAQSPVRGVPSQVASSSCHPADDGRLAGAARAAPGQIDASTGSNVDCEERRSPMIASTLSADEAGASPMHASADAPSLTLTLTCSFSNGPHMGVVADLTGIPGAVAVPVGSRCSDGVASSGTAVARDSDSVAKFWSDGLRATALHPGQPGSTICQFMSGPRAHGWHDYAPLTPAPVGSSCRDGMSSAGVVMAQGHGERY